MALSATLTVADLLPVEVGAKNTGTVQEPPAGIEPPPDGVKAKPETYIQRVVPVVAVPPKDDEFVPQRLTIGFPAALGMFVVFVATLVPSSKKTMLDGCQSKR